MSVTYRGSKSQEGAYFCNALQAAHGTSSCLYVVALHTDKAMVEAFFKAIRPSELSLLEEVFAARSVSA